MLKTTLNHLPENKQANIHAIVDVIHDEFDRVVSVATKPEKKNSRILLILLFGSYAKGTYVEDHKSGYISDYDILVVINEPALVEEYKIWHTVEERAAVKTQAPVNLIVHTLRDINQELRQGQYFFKDIRQQAIQLYQYNHTELLDPGSIVQEEVQGIAQRHFDQWFESASRFFVNGEENLKKGWLKEAAFMLHQSVERYFACLLLVFTNYRPKSHNIKAMHSLVIQQASELKHIFPQDTKFNRRSFQLLKKAYIEARYSEHYEITEEELTWLASEVKRLQVEVERLCKEKIG